jgi:mRNA-degrading endonuclease toxin of MazEF toxin-antitoxin module
LNQTSAVTCGNLFTVAQTKVRRVIGSLSPATMTRISASLKAALELP